MSKYKQQSEEFRQILYSMLGSAGEDLVLCYLNAQYTRLLQIAESELREDQIDYKEGLIEKVYLDENKKDIIRLKKKLKILQKLRSIG